MPCCLLIEQHRQQVAKDSRLATLNALLAILSRIGETEGQIAARGKVISRFTAPDTAVAMV